MIREFLDHFEGNRLEAYPDSGGIYTIGRGHTDGVKKGDKITQKQSDDFLTEDIKIARRRIPMDIDLKENEYEALISMAFNLTTISFNKLIEYLRKDKDLFKSKMLLYGKDIRGNYLPGLLKRRICERLLFEGKDWRAVAKQMEGKTIPEILTIQKQLFGG